VLMRYDRAGITGLLEDIEERPLAFYVWDSSHEQRLPPFLCMLPLLLPFQPSPIRKTVRSAGPGPRRNGCAKLGGC
jgi:hypothetical protein